MLCTMCMHGIEVRRCWECLPPCGAVHCPHILECPYCHTRKRDGLPHRIVQVKPRRST